MNEILVSENTSVRKTFNVVEVVSLYGAIICALKERHHKSGEPCSGEATQRRCDVCYDAAPKRLSCRHRQLTLSYFCSWFAAHACLALGEYLHFSGLLEKVE